MPAPLFEDKYILSQHSGKDDIDRIITEGRRLITVKAQMFQTLIAECPDLVVFRADCPESVPVPAEKGGNRHKKCRHIR